MSDLVLDSSDASDASESAIATTTTGDLINQIRGYLLSGQRWERTKLSAGIDADDGSVAVAYPVQALATGNNLLAVDFEEMHQWTGTASSITAMQRGEFGSTAAGHSAGSIVHINPEWSDFRILREINNELLHLSSPSAGLFQVAHVDITYNPTRVGYDLGVADLIGVVDVRAEVIGPTLDWQELHGWEIIRSQDTADFGSGISLMLYQPGWTGKTIRVFYAAVFSPLPADYTSIVQSVTGLHGQAHDVLAMGAAMRLAGVAEISRNRTDHQGDTRRASEVPPGARNAAPAGLRQQYMARLAAESLRLKKAYPLRQRRI